MNVDGIILDVDGTLWNSTEIVAKAWNKAVSETGIEMEHPITAAILQKEFGKTMQVIAEDLFPKESQEAREALMAACCKLEHEALVEMDEDITYEGVIRTIKELSKMHKVFIVSNCQKGYIELFMEKNKLEAYITDTECYGNTGKNKGDNIRLLADRNGLRKPVYVGDTLGDQEASKQAGVPFIYAAYGFGESSEHVAEITGFAQLLQIDNL